MLKRLTIAAAILALGTSIAQAGVIFIPILGNHTQPELSQTTIEREKSGMRIRTSSLPGAFLIDASNVPQAFNPPEKGCVVLPFQHTMDLQLNCKDDGTSGIDSCLVQGNLQGAFQTEATPLNYHASVSGLVTCISLGDTACVQMVADLDAHGIVRDETDPSKVGIMELRILGSLVRDGDWGQWVSLAASGSLGGDGPIVGTRLGLSTMQDGETCGI